MLDKVINTIAKFNMISPGDVIIIGVSGGPDSVCLLHILKSMSERAGIKLTAAHVNHMLRGDESDADEVYVRRLCERLSIKLVSKTVNILEISKRSGVSLEEAGRDARYDFFETLAAESGARKIAVAHNKNDRAETVIMHIIRGSGLNGLTGMEHVRGKIIRPLLDIDRKEIIRYCEENKLYPRIDSSNLESKYTRNKIRLDLIPYVNSLFDIDITETIYKMSLLLGEDNNFIENTAYNIYNECIIRKGSAEIILDTDKLGLLHTAIQKRVLRNAFKDIKGDLKNIGSIHIEQLAKLAETGGVSSEICLPGGIRASKSYKSIRIYPNEENKKEQIFEKKVNIPGVTIVEDLGFYIEATVVDAASAEKIAYIKGSCGYTPKSCCHASVEQHFDYELVKTGINIRTRRSGDIFKPVNSIGTKKLKEYLIDMKVPREARMNLPLIAKGNEILWIIGYRASDNFKVNEGTKRILKLRFTGRSYFTGGATNFQGGLNN